MMNLILTVDNYVVINQHNDWLINQARRSSVVLCFDLNFNKLQSRNNINIIQVGVIRSMILLMLRSGMLIDMNSLYFTNLLTDLCIFEFNKSHTFTSPLLTTILEKSCLKWPSCI